MCGGGGGSKRPVGVCARGRGVCVCEMEVGGSTGSIRSGFQAPLQVTGQFSARTDIH